MSPTPSGVSVASVLVTDHAAVEGRRHVPNVEVRVIYLRVAKPRPTALIAEDHTLLTTAHVSFPRQLRDP